MTAMMSPPRPERHATCVCGHRQTAHVYTTMSASALSITVNGVEVARSKSFSAESSTRCCVERCGCSVFRNRKESPQRCGRCGALGHKKSTCTLGKERT